MSTEDRVNEKTKALASALSALAGGGLVANLKDALLRDALPYVMGADTSEAALKAFKTYEKREFLRVEAAMQNAGSVFVFGSNLAGRHGGGAALTASTEYGARDGWGVGMVCPLAYAIPTKDRNIVSLPLARVVPHIEVFKDFAAGRRAWEFITTRIGCGLAGFTDLDIAPLFKGAPTNVYLPIGWRDLNGEEE